MIAPTERQTLQPKPFNTYDAARSYAAERNYTVHSIEAIPPDEGRNGYHLRVLIAGRLLVVSEPAR